MHVATYIKMLNSEQLRHPFSFTSLLPFFRYFLHNKKSITKSLGKCNASSRSSTHQERLTNYHVGFYSHSKPFGIHPNARSRIFRAMWAWFQNKDFLPQLIASQLRFPFLSKC
jgi:hypothetical protein